MPNVRKIFRRIGVSLCFLLLLPFIADRPASVCESVKIPNTSWVVEHRVSRTCAYFYCDDYVEAVDLSGKKKNVMLLQFRSNNYDATVKYDKDAGYVYIEYGYLAHHLVKRTEFDGIPVKYEEVNSLFYEDNKDSIEASVKLNELDNRYPPMIDGLRTFFTPNSLRRDEISYRDKLKETIGYTFNDKHYVKKEFKPPFNVVGVNTDCYNFP